jgi:hypothetical protein
MSVDRLLPNGPLRQAIEVAAMNAFRIHSLSKTAGLLGLVIGCGAVPANAAPEEIQVYMDELNNPGEIGLDIHNNYVLSGDSAVDYAGEQPSAHRFRLTPEWSLGLGHSFELGAYLPLTTIDRGSLSIDGFKFRLKWLAPRSDGQNWFWGANFEIGREDHRLDQNPWNAELKGIAGIHSGKWTAAANANLDFKVSGPAPSPATLEIATKVDYAVSPKTALGIENYSGVGEVRELGQFGRSEQSTYVTADTRFGKWVFNFGVGHGYGRNPDKWILKAIVSVPLNWSIMSRSASP